MPQTKGSHGRESRGLANDNLATAGNEDGRKRERHEGVSIGLMMVYQSKTSQGKKPHLEDVGLSVHIRSLTSKGLPA